VCEWGGRGQNNYGFIFIKILRVRGWGSGGKSDWKFYNFDKKYRILGMFKLKITLWITKKHPDDSINGSVERSKLR